MRENEEAGHSMLMEERRAHILKLLREHGQVRVRQLSQQLHTSEVTIRNDLKELHQRGLVNRSHGGAMVPGTQITESTLQERFQKRIEEKRRIGLAAADMINEGETIILDSGTTTQEIARNIRGKQGLQVITNGVNVAMELLGVRGIQLIIVGGMLRDDSVSVVGHFAEEMLEHFSADKLFLGAAACDLTFGISTPNMAEARVNQSMVRIAREMYGAVDLAAEPAPGHVPAAA